jgi:hypothetical protein
VQSKYLVKKGIGEYDNEKCHLISFLNFHGLLRYPLAVWMYSKAMCICTSKLLGWNGARGGGISGFSQNS